MAGLQSTELSADHNLCNLSREDQDYLSAKTLAHYWLHLKRHKQMTRQDINKRLSEMPDRARELHRKALNEAIEERKAYGAQQ